MSPNARRFVTRRPFLNCCLLLGLLLASVAGLPSLTRKVGAVFVAPGFPESTKALRPAAVPTAQTRLRESYGKLPLRFEANQGQTDQRVKFLARGPGYNLFLTADEAVLSLSVPVTPQRKQARLALAAKTSDIAKRKSQAVVTMKLVGANPQSRVEGLEELAGKSNYFNGSASQSRLPPIIRPSRHWSGRGDTLWLKSVGEPLSWSSEFS
jgi:hypothetical protein